MVHGLKALAVFAKVLGLVPGTNNLWLTTAYNSSFKGSKNLFWHLWALWTCCIHIDKQAHTHKKKPKMF